MFATRQDDKNTACQDITDPRIAAWANDNVLANAEFMAVSEQAVSDDTCVSRGDRVATSGGKSSKYSSGEVIQRPGMYTHHPTEINYSTGISSNLGLEAFWIPGEQARSSNVV